MGYKRVTVIDPDGAIYDAEVDEEATSDALLQELIRQIALPTRAADGEPIDYRLRLQDSLKLRDGDTLVIDEARPRSSIRIIRKLS